MAREAPSRGDRFVHGLLVCFEVFLVLRWMMLEKVLGVVAWRGGGAALLSYYAFARGRYGRAGLPPTLTWGSRLLGRGDRVSCKAPSNLIA
jgi:hypothetical protein